MNPLVLKDATCGNTDAFVPTITLKVPPETAARLERAAKRRRISKSEVIREALDQKLRESDESPTVYDLMRRWLGAFESGTSDLGHNPKHLRDFGRR